MYRTQPYFNGAALEQNEEVDGYTSEQAMINIIRPICDLGLKKLKCLIWQVISIVYHK